jgi:hypothetical protein
VIESLALYPVRLRTDFQHFLAAVLFCVFHCLTLCLRSELLRLVQAATGMAPEIASVAALAMFQVGSSPLCLCVSLLPLCLPSSAVSPCLTSSAVAGE